MDFVVHMYNVMDFVVNMYNVVVVHMYKVYCTTKSFLQTNL